MYRDLSALKNFFVKVGLEEEAWDVEAIVDKIMEDIELYTGPGSYPKRQRQRQPETSQSGELDRVRSGESTVQEQDKDLPDDKHVTRIQKLLIDLGHTIEGAPSGDFDGQTADAVEEFQRNNQEDYGLEPNGIVDSKTLIVLESVLANPANSSAAQGSSAQAIASRPEAEAEEPEAEAEEPEAEAEEPEADREDPEADREDPEEYVDLGNDLNRLGSSVALDAFADAIAKKESGGNYNAVNEESDAHGKYQIMPDNWPGWARQAGLSSNARKTPRNQEIVARYKLREYFDDLGEWWLVAVKWYSGGGGVARMKRLRETDPSLSSARRTISYRGGRRRYSGIATYADKVMKEYYANMGQVYEGVQAYASLGQNGKWHDDLTDLA